MDILIVKMSSLGDIIHAFPVLQYLKQTDPSSHIDWVVEQPFMELVQAHPLVNRVLSVQTKKWRSQLMKSATWQEIIRFRQQLHHHSYDVVLDLQGNIKSGIVTGWAISSFKVGFGYASVPEWPNVLMTHRRYNPPLGKNIREDYLFLAQSAMNNFTTVVDEGVELKLTLHERLQLEPILERLQKVQGLKVMVCSGSNWVNKQLSRETLKSFLQIFSKWSEAHFVFIWGHEAEKALVDDLASDMPDRCSVIDRLSLPALQNVMRQCDLVLAMDSLPLHLAGTTSTPTFSVFGASSAHKYKPMIGHHEAFQGNCPYGNRFEKRCSLLRSCKTGACIKQIEGQALFDHFYDWWLYALRST